MLERAQRQRIAAAAEACESSGHRAVFWAGYDPGADAFKLVCKIYSGRGRFPIRQATIARAETRNGIERFRQEALEYFQALKEAQ